MRWTISIKADPDYSDMIEYLRRIQREANFEQVVLEGITAIQRFQRQAAPVGKEGSIPRSIKPARIVRMRDGAVRGSSKTNSERAWFTNEGTWTGRRTDPEPPTSRYRIVQEKRYSFGPREGQPYIVNIDHPGIKAQKWFDKGFEQGVPVAEGAFRRKVGRMLRGRN